jgi:hypothetical protein
MTLELLSFALLAVEHEGDDGAGGSRAGSPAGAVEIGRVVGRWVIVNHEIEARNVEASRCDICRDKNR